MFKGVYTALVTPFREDGGLDEAALRKLVDLQIAGGVAGLVPMGTTGESPTVDHEEHTEVIRVVIEQARGRVPVIAGTGSNSTREAIELTQAAREAGAHAALVVTPYYNKPPQEGLYQHYKALAEAVDLPIILYNVPGRTGCDMLPATVARLAQLRNIVGLKEASGDLARVRELLALGLPADFALYSGDDALVRESILLGFHGTISVTANIAPRLMHELCAAAAVKDVARAVAIDAQLAGLHKYLFAEPNPIPVKWALHELGRIPAGLRLPLVPLASHFAELRGALRSAGVLK